MRHFPVFLDLRGRVALVIGEGPVAARKAAMLARAGATLRTARRFMPGLLHGVAVAVGAGRRRRIWSRCTRAPSRAESR